MARKITNKTKVVKKPTQSTKPKGKVVKASVVQDVTQEVPKDDTSVGNSNIGNDDKLVDDKTISKALNELKKYVLKKTEESEEGKSQLFEDDLINNLQLIISKKNYFTIKKNFKPKLINIKNKPINKDLQPRVILFIRDDIIDKNLLEKIEESEVSNLISEIITGSELKTTYKQYEKRRELYSNNDLFISDDALITSLPKLLGKIFYDSNKKLPIPIKISKEKFSINSIINHIKKIIFESIFYSIPRSNNLTINLGSLEFINEDVISQIISYFNEKYDDLRSIFLKTNQSPSLPLYDLDIVYTESDIETGEDKSIKGDDKTDGNKIDIKGLPENIKLSEFEKGLIELANPDEIPQLFSNKIKKSIKQAKREKRDKVSKPVNKKKTIKKVKAWGISYIFNRHISLTAISLTAIFPLI